MKRVWEKKIWLSFKCFIMPLKKKKRFWKTWNFDFWPRHPKISSVHSFEIGCSIVTIKYFLFVGGPFHNSFAIVTVYKSQFLCWNSFRPTLNYFFFVCFFVFCAKYRFLQNISILVVINITIVIQYCISINSVSFVVAIKHWQLLSVCFAPTAILSI